MKVQKVSSIFLPKTDFPLLPKNSERALLAIVGDFSNFYSWQKTRSSNHQSQQKRFILLDGPPYANGDAHVGHAINKLFKDFIMKNRVQMGFSVDYKPGWDCHGLPIELKIQRHHKGIDDLDPLWIRRSSRQIALNSMQAQKTAFIRWGCTADFDNPYLTMNPDYVARQLELFADLFEKGLVQRLLQPVYWSPSSRTALAESELEYNEEHKSTAVYFRFRLLNFDFQKLQNQINTSTKPAHFYLLIWTTTPWTIPMNNAIAVNSHIEYAAFEFRAEKRPITNVYIVSKKLLPDVVNKLERGEVLLLGTISGSALAQSDFCYKNAMYNDLAQPIVSADFVKDDVGTGIVHLSYAHGYDDFQVGNRTNCGVECFIDEFGRYTHHMGNCLEGKEVLGDGNQAALNLLRKDVLHVSEFVHSYPYDWRTGQPVIIRSCPQWFLDVSSINKRCVQALEGEAPELQVFSSTGDTRSAFINLFTNRDYWCISRQRAWGVPIPAIKHSKSAELYTNAEFIREYAKLVRWFANTDLWWTLSLEELSSFKGFPCSVENLHEIEKCTEIMDVWMDSGMAWHTLQQETKLENAKNECTFPIADIVVEGADQFRGWFQSSLITSLALRDAVPFKQIHIHGMAVDDEGKKMSKSKGNVIIPEAITDGTLKNSPIGVDGLRYWAAWLGCDPSLRVKIGPSTLEMVQARLKNIRLILRFILGTLNSADKAKKKLNGSELQLWRNGRLHLQIIPELRILDRDILNSSDALIRQLRSFYSDCKFNLLTESYFQFTQKEASSYITYVRDRLYADPINSCSHDAAIFTLDLLGRVLITSIAPILPHLTVEYFTHHPLFKFDPAIAFRQTFDDTNITLQHSELQKLIGDRVELERLMELIHQTRERIAGKLKQKKSECGKEHRISAFGVKINATAEQLDLLCPIHSQSDQQEHHSDLVELLGSPFIQFGHEPVEELQVDLLEPHEAGMGWCIRCRMMRNPLERIDAGLKMCKRCENADKLVNLTKQTATGNDEDGNANKVQQSANVVSPLGA